MHQHDGLFEGGIPLCRKTRVHGVQVGYLKPDDIQLHGLLCWAVGSNHSDFTSYHNEGNPQSDGGCSGLLSASRISRATITLRTTSTARRPNQDCITLKPITWWKKHQMPYHQKHTMLRIIHNRRPVIFYCTPSQYPSSCRLHHLHRSGSLIFSNPSGGVVSI